MPNGSSRYPFTRAVGLLGRNEDILWFRDGNGKQEFLHPLAVEGFCVKGLCDYQFRQISPDTFEMLAEVPDDTLRENVRGGNPAANEGYSAGKSTLLYALSGMDTITAGSVTFNGQEINSLSEKKMAQLRAEAFGFIFQQTHLVSNLTLFENVAVAGYAAKAGSVKEIRETADRLLFKMHVRDAKDRLPSQVSGGEAQRAAIARAMIGNPSLIFADEPTGALNKANSEEVIRLLMELNHDGQSILMVTHDVRAALYGNRILYLEDGKILDKCSLSPYGQDDLKNRESKVMGWLSGLGW